MRDGFLEQRLQQAQSELQMTQQSTQQMQQQMQGLQQQLAQSNSQIQMAQQQAAQAQQAAMQAQQQQLQQADDALRTQQMAAQMRTAFQELRGRLMELATTDPALSVGQEMKGQAPELNPTGGPPPQVAPGGMPADGASAAPAEGGSSAPMEEQAAEPKMAADPAAIAGGLGGAALGAGLAWNESQTGPARHKASLEKLQKAEQSGQGGFVNALQQAKAKALLASSEAAAAHPNAATALGAGMGAISGVGAGKAISGLVSR